MKTLSSLFVSVFAYLVPLGQLQWNNHFLQEKFIELSEIHWANMFYPYIYTDSSSLVNVSPWE